MLPLEEQVDRLLDGQGIPDTIVDIITREKDKDFKPITKCTVGYIVCGIAINEQGEILMMQEAKHSCRGLWYLPAGRLEVGESLQDGVKREVQEETGLVFEPTSLIAIECGGNNWYRFTFIGKTVGGRLKTTNESDSESLQAKWVSVEKAKRSSKDFVLRANDIIPLIDIAFQYHHKNETSRHPLVLPSTVPQTQMILRIVIACCDDEGCAVAVSDPTNVHIPSCLVSKTDFNFTIPIFRVLKGVFQDYKPTRPDVGILSVEFAGKPPEENDGVCITLLMKSEVRHKTVEPFYWQNLDTSYKSKITDRFQKGRTVPMIFY